MPNIRDKIIDMIGDLYGVDPMYYGVDAVAIADHLVAHGVTIQKKKRKVKPRKRHALTNEALLALEKIGNQTHGGVNL